MKTFTPRKEDVKEKWYLVDAEGKTLGRMATAVASLLRGKTSPEFTPHLGPGTHVIIVNAEKVKVTGRKREQKTYFRHSGYPGGMRLTSFKKLQAAKPEKIVMLAVKGMIPKTKLGRDLLTNLKIYAGPSHPHAAQRPENFEIVL